MQITRYRRAPCYDQASIRTACEGAKGVRDLIRATDAETE
jgi:hypothetical protein